MLHYIIIYYNVMQLIQIKSFTFHVLAYENTECSMRIYDLMKTWKSMIKNDTLYETMIANINKEFQITNVNMVQTTIMARQRNSPTITNKTDGINKNNPILKNFYENLIRSTDKYG